MEEDVDDKHTQGFIYQPNILVYDVNSASAIFQRTMGNILAGIDDVACYLDDILISARSKEQHLHRLYEILSRIQRCGIRLKLPKWMLLQEKVEYIGHMVPPHRRKCVRAEEGSNTG